MSRVATKEQIIDDILSDTSEHCDNIGEILYELFTREQNTQKLRSLLEEYFADESALTKWQQLDWI